MEKKFCISQMWSVFPNVSLIQNFGDDMIGWIAQLIKFGFQLIITVCSLLCQMLRPKIYVCKFTKINNFSYAQIIFMASEAGNGGFNKDPMFGSVK